MPHTDEQSRWSEEKRRSRRSCMEKITIAIGSFILIILIIVVLSLLFTYARW